MDQNFHYHVTYTAALAAGFPAPDSLVIARAARYVDEDSATCQGVWTLAMDNVWDSLAGDYSQVIKLLRIWPVFHFLPGQYSKISNDVGTAIIKNHDDRFSLAPWLICGTESQLTADLVAGAKLTYAGAGTHTAKLIRIGIAMHTLADTFAHQGFAGVPLSCINEVSAVKTATDFGRLQQQPYAPLVNYSPALSYDSFGYLGHGRIGHLPDKPGATFHYKAAWREPTRDPYIIRYNPLEFLCAYIQMVEAMQSILMPDQVFSNLANRDKIVTELSTPGASIVEPYVRAFVQAPEDRDLPRSWYGAFTGANAALAPFGPILPTFTAAAPAQYIPLSEDPSPNLLTEFKQAAADQVTLVTTHSHGLRAYIDFISLLRRP